MKRVMLVDDDRDLVELFAGQLVRVGYQVRYADSQDEAVRVVASEAPFDLLITDLNLPDGDAASVAAALKIPINVALTGSSSAVERQRLLRLGFADVWVKPLFGKQLTDSLSRIFKGLE